ncbi:carboxylate-amine ligase [Blastococcus litoris]|uniref:carboxylate-amine ligase n=1 Tax=Blastococcus litoris TaxID=2171622 RepID=UPI0013DEAC52|nr:YbdK family carboxylate-amine ligase [Blastococcus litoris]
MTSPLPPAGPVAVAGPAAAICRPRPAADLLVPVAGDAVPTIGVEEEFLLLWPDGGTATVAPDVIAAVAPEIRAAAEFSRCQVESSTGICRDLSSVGVDLSVARRALAQAAADRGARLVPVGAPPVDEPGAADLTDDDRYRRLLTTVPGVTGEEITCAGQVHVAVPSRDVGVAVLGRLRPWLPLLLALTGNSPVRRGRDTGWSSTRFLVQRRWPSFLPPPRCAGAAEYDAGVDRLMSCRAALDERGVYYWARLSPRYPTVEVRIADVGLTVGEAVLLAGLCRAAVMTALADELAGRPLPDVPERVLLAAGYAAARRGLGAVVLDPAHGGWAPARALLPAWLDVLGPALEAAGDRSLVETLLAAQLCRGPGSDRQRALLRRGRRGFVQALANLGAGIDA